MSNFLGFSQYLIEQSLSRVYDHTKNRSIGIITASRGNYDGKTAEEHDAWNKARNKRLEKDLRDAGHSYIKVTGRYTENKGTPEEKKVTEHSYLVIGKKSEDDKKGKHYEKMKSDIIHLGKKYNQDSVLIKHHSDENAHLHGTAEGGFPGLGVVHSVGKWHPNRTGEFYSQMKGNKTFTFEDVAYLNHNSFFVRGDSLWNYTQESFD